MSMYRRAASMQVKRDFQGIPAGSGSTMTLPGRSMGRQGAVYVNEDMALGHSGVWASTRLRADLVSTFPVGVFRDLNGMPTDAGTPPIILSPGGKGWDFVDWMWASQHDLDYVGNTIGLITARNGIQTPFYPDGLPAEIQLADSRACSVIKWKGQVLYRINGSTYQAKDVYHERQFPWSGTPIGLSPLMYAAASVGEYISLQKYSTDWFAGGGVPKAWMKNTIKRLGNEERDFAKQWYRDTVQNGDLMVTGNDWEYNMIQAEQAGMEWLEGRRFGLGEVARFFGVPSDLIDAAVSGQAITYANISQRNLEFLIMHLGPAVKRREKNLSQLLPLARYVKLNTDALLRLDPQTRQEVLRSKLETWQITNDEARNIEDLKPLTDKDIERMTEIYGKPKAGGAGPPTPGEAATDPALAPGGAPAAPGTAPAKPGAPAPGKPAVPAKPPAKTPVPAK